MPFGAIFRGWSTRYWTVVSGTYINDVIVFSKAGLTLKKRKSQFRISECGYLGHMVGSGRVCLESAKIEAVKMFE